jgi:hypothetical protein
LAVAKHVSGVMKIHAGGPGSAERSFFAWPRIAVASGCRPAA